MTAEVEGILKFNNDIRDEMLARNLGKYSQIDFKLKPAIGEYYEIDDYRPLKDAKNGKDMLSFTHDGKSDYSKEIKRKYFSFGEEEPYYVRQLTYGELNPWISFQQGNYIKYIDEVFGKDEVMRHVDYVNNILSGRFIENALRQTEVGVIEDINVPVALQGIVTTNPNNMSGEDTILGKISNRMYAQTLYNGAMFNSTRMRAEIRDGENYYNKAYITPYLVNKYGNNMATVMQLSDIMKINANETHIREDLGADIHILDGYGDNSFADLSKPEFRLLNEQIQSAIISNGFSRDKFGDKLIIMNYDGLLPRQMYTLEEHYGYVDDVKDDYAFRFNSFSQRNEDNTFSASENNGSSGRISGKYNMLVYNEGGSNYSGNPNMLERLDDKVDEFNTFDSFSVINDETTGSYDLMNKTNILFRENELDTLIGRFHTSKDEYKYPEFTDTARSAFGNSHGRNLLVLDALEEKPTTNGYSNPYCRTWTFHHQYNQVKKLIRPFTLRVGDRERPYTLKEVQSMNKKYRAFRNDSGKENAIIGYERLADNTVLQNNGFVRITPKSGDEKSKIKNCMFSIENLAWKDVLKHEDNLSVEQTGPNGGRIMWFPPYDLDFQESVNVDWNQNTFIGRGEKVYTYTNTDRTGTLSFSLLIDHPAIINSVTKDSYEGMGKEKDPEADILRFFAGCELLPETEKTGGEIEKEREKPESKPKKGHIKFKIYFPNNFTGLITNRLKLEGHLYDEFNNYVVTDNGGTTVSTYDEKYAKDYWWQYLLVGNNTCVPDERKDFRGYEMLPVPEDKKDAKETEKNCGLSNVETQYTDKPLPTCQGNKKIEGEIDRVRTIDGYRISCTVDKLDRTQQYHYFVDEDLHQQIDETSYFDTNSFRLNATFDNAIKNKVARRADEFTFAEVILALLEVNEADEVYGPLYRKYKDYILDDVFPTSDSIGYSPYANYSDLVRIFSNKDLKFKKVTYRGSADNNDSPNAKMLAFRRGTVGSELIKRLLHTELEMKNAGLIVGGKSGVAAYLEEQKQNRYCYFDIEYEIPSENFKDGAGNRNGNVSAEERVQRIEQIRKQSEADKKAKEDAAFNKEYVYAYGPDLDKVPNNRYETEGEYFKNIDIKDPVLYKNLKDKFKYFNPAYHSISPEGFNARLTFLHQCTRQGQTVEAVVGNGNKYTGTASNLAFGRMPVCVIRIGDFINTRAIINSMSITYAASNGMVWDLNPEGAGVQPMYAKISLQITLLGGQSLEAPISRLQNAISFNYYANAEVYDNRADVAIYKPAEKEGGNGYVEYRRIWSPLSKEYEYENEQLVETGRLVNNDTDDFNERHANDGTWHDLTDEQIDDVFNGNGNSDPADGDTPTDELVYSSDMSKYISSYSEVVDIVTGPTKRIHIYVYCNKGYIDSGYKKSEYKKNSVTYDLQFMPGVTNKEYILGELEKAMRNGIDKFVNTH